MTAIPELEARPRAQVAPEARPDSPMPSRRSLLRLSRTGLPWARLLAVLLVACLTQVIYVFLWPLSYFMTQTPDYTYEYLVEYPAAWQRLLVLLARFEELWPGASRSLDFLVDSLMQAFIGAFILYLIALMLVRGGLPPVLGTVAVVGPLLAYHATLFAMPGLYTTDIFSYVMYGHVAGVLNVNPYTSIPSMFPEVRIFYWIHPIWRDAPSIYGPPWL